MGASFAEGEPEKKLLFFLKGRNRRNARTFHVPLRPKVVGFGFAITPAVDE
jgi:hypothetical protein